MVSTATASAPVKYPGCILALKAASFGTGLAGIAFGAMPETVELICNKIYFDSRGLEPALVTPEARNYGAFVLSVAGAVMFGWAVQMYMTVDSDEFKRGDRRAWLSVVLPMEAWFVTDCFFSYSYGFWPNCVVNVAFAAMFIIPLAIFKVGVVDENTRISKKAK